MTPVRITVILLLAGAATAGCAAEKSLRFDTEGLVGAWVDMWNTYDLSQVERLFLNGDNVTYFSSVKPGLIRGIVAVREHHSGFDFVAGGKDQSNILWMENLHTQLYDSIAVVNGIWYFEKGPVDNREIQKGPVTIVYAPAPDGYRIAHMHFAHYEPPQ